jgi:hypothetical protein
MCIRDRFDVVDGAYIDLGAGCVLPNSDASNAQDNTAVGAFTELGIKF